MKSLEFFKPTLAATLAIVLAWLLSVRPAQAGYTVTLQQVGLDVVATGSGPIDLHGLTFSNSVLGTTPQISSNFRGCSISTGPVPFRYQDPRTGVDYYGGASGPMSFGGSGEVFANSGGGDTVGIAAGTYLKSNFVLLSVPRGYVSGTFLSDSATYSGTTLASLGVTPGTYVWTWGTGANQKFTLQIRTPGPASTAIWYLNNNMRMSGAFAPRLPVGWTVVGVADFNGDSQPDYLLYNVSTRQTTVWYLDNNVFVSGANGPTLPAGWKVIGVADFDGDGRPDYLLFNSTSHQTAIWYLSGTTFVSGAYGPSLPDDWALVAVGDFNADGKPDYVLYSPSFGQTAIWYLYNNVLVRGAFGPTLPVKWRGLRGAVVGVADFNGDNKPDYLLFNSSTGQTAIWYLSGPTFIGGAFGPTIVSGYTLIGAADFDRDGKPDYALLGPSVQ